MRNLSLFSGLNDLLSFDPYENFAPSFNQFWEKEGNKLVAHFDLPGLTKDQIKVSINEQTLSVYGSQEDKKAGGFRNRSYSYKTFIPKEVDTESLSASYENGVLKIEASINQASKNSKFLEIK